MRFIPTRVHGIMDYLMSALLIVSPWLFGFAEGGAETWLPVVLGVAMMGMAAMTDYELGLVKKISIRTHLTIDLISGLLLAASPWIFGFADYVWAPHLILGLLEVGAALTTENSPRPVHPTGGAGRPAVS